MGTERASTGRFILYLIVLFCFETRSCYAVQAGRTHSPSVFGTYITKAGMVIDLNWGLDFRIELALQVGSVWRV